MALIGTGSLLWTKRTYFLVDSMMSLCNRWDFIGKILRAPIPFFWPLKVRGFYNLVFLVKCFFTWTDLHGHSFPGDISSMWFSSSLIAPYVLCESSPKGLGVYKPRASAFSFISVTFLHCLLLVTQATLKLALEPKWLQTDTRASTSWVIGLQACTTKPPSATLGSNLGSHEARQEFCWLNYAPESLYLTALKDCLCMYGCFAC